jgi:hypothetical protein
LGRLRLSFGAERGLVADRDGGFFSKIRNTFGRQNAGGGAATFAAQGLLVGILPGAVLAVAILIAGVAKPDAALAQAPPILLPGNAIVTGFSGAPLPAQIAPGLNPGDQTFIDLNGPSARVFNLQTPGAPPQAQVIPAPSLFAVTAAQVGQVFAVTLDNATPPNIYLAATSA